MRLWAILAGAAFVAMTGIGPRPPAPKATPPAGTQSPSARPCPAEELSCGLQKPVISDGVRPFANENYGLRVTFPRGSAVCLTRSGDAPHGFFAVYRTEAGCAERPERPPTFISIYAEFNATFLRSLAEVVPSDCRPPSGAVRHRIGGWRPALPGLRSVACQTLSRDGAIEIAVYAMAGTWPDGDTPPEARSPYVIYTVTLGTTPAHIESDVARFREVLRSLRIRPT